MVESSDYLEQANNKFFHRIYPVCVKTDSQIVQLINKSPKTNHTVVLVFPDH